MTILAFNPFDIYGSFLRLLWTVFVQGPLLIINSFNNVLYYLSGGVITDLLFGGSKSFSFDTVPKAFFIFLAISAIFFVLIYVIQLIVIQFKKTSETKGKILKCLESSLLAWLFIFVIPIAFYLLNATVMVLSKALIGMFAENQSIAAYLYHAGDPNWDGTVISNTPPNFSAPDNIKEWNMFAAMIGSCFMLYICCMLGMLLIQKIIELFFLFIISPLIMTVMILDDGKAANLWKDMVIAKFLASSAALTGFFVFIAALQAIASSGLSGLDSGGMSKQFFFLLFTMGGGMATLYFTSMIGEFIGERVGISEARQNFQSVMTASAGLAGTTGAVLGFIGLKKNRKANKVGIPGTSGNLMNSTKDIMSQGIKPLPNALAKRSGIIGLSGLAIGGTAAAVGGTIAGAKKAWKAGDRNGTKGKLKGIARVATAPVTGTAKGVGKFLNPKAVATGKASYQNKINYHVDQNLKPKRNNLKEKYNSQVKEKGNVKNMKEFVKSRQEINKSNKKIEKFNTKINKFDSNKSSEKK